MQPGAQGKRRRGYDEDLVNFDFSPYGKGASSRSRSPRRPGGSGVSSALRSPSGDDPVEAAATGSRLNQARLERREERPAPLDEVQITDIKLQEMQKELRSMPKQPQQQNATAERLQRTGTQMKTSLIKLRSVSQSKDKPVLPQDKEEPIAPDSTKHRSPLQMFKTQTNTSKLNGSRSISPMAQTEQEKKARISTMEELCEKESEETRAKVSGIEGRLGLEDRLVEQTWQVRRNAYAELAKIFSGEIKPDSTASEGKDDANAKPAEHYASWLSYILKENNLIALHEGLGTVLIYTQNATALSPAVGLVPDLLDKMPLHKPQFQEIVTKILCELVKRDQAHYVVSELAGRFATKKSGKGSPFPINCLCAMLKTELYEEIELKQVYRAAAASLGNGQREVKLSTVRLMQTIFEVVDDSVEVFVSHLPEGTKPFLVKELADTLRSTPKRQVGEKVRLFAEGSEAGGAGPASEEQKKQPGAQAQTRKERAKKLSSTQLVQQQQETVNLYDFVNEEVFKLVYVTKAEEKKMKIEELNIALEGLEKQGCRVEKKDYSGLVNVLCTLLEDTNVFLQLEVLKCLQHLTALLGRDMAGLKPRHIVGKLLDRMKENKTAVTLQIEATVASLLLHECILPESLIEVCMQRLTASKNPRVRQLSLQVLSNRLMNGFSIPETGAGFIPAQAVERTFSTTIGPKLLSVIHKDPAAGVRDAAVQLLTKVKLLCPGTAEVEQTIAKLPRARIQAIYAQIRAGMHSSKTPRERLQSGKKSRQDMQEMQRSRSEMKITHSKSFVSAVPSSDCSTEERVKRLLRIAENGTAESILSELQAWLMTQEELQEQRQHVLYSITYYLTRKSGGKKACDMNPAQAEVLANVLSQILDASPPKETGEQELDCAVSCGIILAELMPTQQTKRYLVLTSAYRTREIDRVVLSLQKVLYTFKYSNSEDLGMRAGMEAYRVVADWLLASTTWINPADLEKLSGTLNISATMGFAPDFVALMARLRQQIQKSACRVQETEVQEAIATASSMAMSLKVPTPRNRAKAGEAKKDSGIEAGTMATRKEGGMPTPRRMSKSHQQLQQILEGINQKEAVKNKKAVESLGTFLDEVNTKQKGMLYAPYILLQELVEGLCKLVDKAQWLEDNVLAILIRLRAAVTAEEAGKLARSVLQIFAEFMQPDKKNGKLLEYYKTVSAWVKDMSKKEITTMMNDIFSGCSFRYDSGSSNHFTIQLRASLHWLRTQILGESFAGSDLEPILTYLVRGLKSSPGLRQECESLLKQAYKLWGVKRAQTWVEESLADSQTLYKIYAEWHDSCFGTKEQKKDKASPEKKPTKPVVSAKKSPTEAGVEKGSGSVGIPLGQSLDTVSPIKKPEEKTNNPRRVQSPIKVEGEEKKSKTEQQTAREDVKANTAPISVLQTLQVISPRFGSELGSAVGTAAGSKNDTPLSLQELDDNNRSETAATKPFLAAVPEELLVSACKEPQKLQSFLLDLSAEQGLVQGVSEAITSYFDKCAIDIGKSLELVKGINASMGDEDVAQCISVPVLFQLADACLKMCATEKIRVAGGTSGMKEIVGACNAVISELQGCLTRIVNSHSFTMVLAMLVSLVRSYLPEDFSVELRQDQVVYIRLLLICFQKTFRAATKDTIAASQSEKRVNIAGLRVFALLLELYRLFQRHPPEKLRQDQPSLCVFDFVYKVLREFTDVLVECDVEKGVVFVTWAEKAGNCCTFLKYVKSVVARNISKSSGESK